MHVKSEMCLSSINESPKDAFEIHEDVDIIFGSNNISPAMKPIVQGIFIDGQQLHMSLGEYGSIQILNGKRIVLDIQSKDYDDLFELYILGSSLAIIMIQRKIMSFHGGFIELNNRHIVITGSSGAGKSSLVTRLLKNQGKLISDDVIPLKINEKKIYGCYSYPTQKVHQSLIDLYNLENRVIRRLPEIDKRDKYIINRKDQFLQQVLAIDMVIEVEVNKDILEPELTKLQYYEKVERLIRHFYRVEYYRFYGLQQQHLQMSMRMAKTIPYYVLSRPEEGITVEQQYHLIKTLIH